MPIYFDTSSFVPLFVVDLHTAPVENFFETRTERPAISDLTMIELVSTVSRRVRMRRIDLGQANEALARARDWMSHGCDRIELISADYNLGEEFVRRFDLGLRAPDALHIALCRRLGLTLVTCDVAQARAASELGIKTITLPGETS